MRREEGWLSGQPTVNLARDLVGISDSLGQCLWKAVEDENVVIEVAVDHVGNQRDEDPVGHEIASRHDRRGLLADLASRRDRGAQEVPARELLQAQLTLQPAGPRRGGRQAGVLPESPGALLERIMS